MTRYKRAVFHHIPKTGGSAVVSALTVALGGRHKRAPWGVDTTPSREFDEDPEAKLFSSHHLYNPDDFTPGPDDFHFTWVRDPVDMVYSAYYFFSKPDPGGNWGGVKLGIPPDEMGRFDLIPQHSTIESYIDACLDDIDSVFYPLGEYQRLWTCGFHFVGSASTSLGDYTELCALLGAEPTTLRMVNVTRDKGPYTYRRNELCVVLNDDRVAMRELIRNSPRYY